MGDRGSEGKARMVVFISSNLSLLRIGALGMLQSDS